MKPQYHVASSALIAGILYLYFKSWGMALSCLLSGILIDIDHIVDYIKAVGLPFNFMKLYNTVYSKNTIRWNLVLHSWELIFLILIIAWLTNWNPWITGILIGFSHHLILDMVFNGIKFRTYFSTWKLKKQFERETVFPGLAKKKLQD